MYVNITFMGVCVTTVDVEKQKVFHVLSVHLLPWVSSMQCAWAILSSVACPPLPHFSTLAHKGKIFLKKLLNVKRLL